MAAKKTKPSKKVRKPAAAKKVGTKKAGKKVARKVAKKKVAKKVLKKAVKKTAAKKPSEARSSAPKTNPSLKTAPEGPKIQKKKLTERAKGILGIRDRLVKQKESLLYEAENAMSALPDQTIFPDLGDQASAETDRSFMLRLRGREQRLLKKIDEAIERIDDGSFGICDSCGEEIQMERLQARPVTTMCINCKTEQEEEEKLSGQ